MINARTYLEKVSKLNKLIENKLKEVEQWRAIAEGSSVISSGERVQTSISNHKLEDAVIHIVELENEANQMIDIYANMKQDIISIIEKIDDAVLYDILHKRYIQGIPMTEIAIILGISWESAKRKHKKALALVQEILDKRCQDE